MPIQSVALIAHDRMKPKLIEFAKKHQNILKNYRLVATGTTGKKLIEATKLKIFPQKSGPLGGDIEIASQILSDEYKFVAVIFIVDPLFTQPHEPDIKALIRICELYDIPFATNISTAHCILESLHIQSKL